MFSIQSAKQIIKHIQDRFHKYPSFDISVLETQLQDPEDIRKCKQHDENNGGQQSGNKVQVCNLRKSQQEQQKLSKYKCEDKEQRKQENQQKQQNSIGYYIEKTKLADQSILDFTQPNIQKTSNIQKNKSFLNNWYFSITNQTQQQIPNKTPKQTKQTKQPKWSTKTIKHKLTTVLNEYIIKNVNITTYKIKQILDNYGIGNDYRQIQQNSQIYDKKEDQLDVSLKSQSQIQDRILLGQDQKQKIKDQKKSKHGQDICCMRDQQCLSKMEYCQQDIQNSIN